MYPPKFEYYRASTVQEAVSLLQEHPEAQVLAGGHSLIPLMKLRLATPGALVDIGRVSEMTGIEQTNGTIRIGALTTHRMLETSELLREKCPLVAEAAAEIGDRQVRNKGTIGGNLAHADPGSDLPGVVRALDATLKLVGPGGERSVAAADFFVGLLTTAIQPGEILTAIEVPVLGDNTGSAYLKFEHPASGYAICGAAAVVTLADDGTCQEARLAFNGVSTTPHRAGEVEAELVGKVLDEATVAAAMEKLSIDEPMGDIHASGEYRVHLARVYGQRAILRAAEQARGGQ
jgi:carbon-monoxide dehydrogenase medium subunit